MKILWTQMLFLTVACVSVGINLQGAETEGKPLWQPYYISPREGPQHLSLDGEWELGYRDTPIATIGDLASQQKWIQSLIPNSVQWALYQAGTLPYPYGGLNTRKYAWVPDKVWYQRRRFEVPTEAQGDYAFLCFDGVGYYARIWLNGTLIGRHEGMFGGPHVEVSRWLNFGKANEIVVELKAGSYGVEHWNPDLPGKVVLPWGSAGGSKYVTTASGIDPKEIEPLGIWQGVRLEITPRVHIERPFLVTEKANESRADLGLNLEVLVHTTTAGDELHPTDETQLATIRESSLAKPANPPLTLLIELAVKGSTQTALRRRISLTMCEGRNWIRQEFTVPSPQLWWPNGMGAANLYRVTLTLEQQGKILDRLEFDYGIRTIETVRSPGPQTQDRWTNWQFVVNGRPLFIKGANWAWPLDVLLHLPPEKYRWLLQAAQAGGIQMLRVWGGGNTETDEFFQLCDQLGIMVWEDFPVGNMETPDWPQGVWEAQVLQTVFRLRNHPALAVWCGGNEFNAYAPGNAATVGIMERSVRDFDGTRAFLRTTPDLGDAHIYTDMDPTWYGHLYQWAPFISETGVFNMPETASLLEVIDPRELSGPIPDVFSKDFASRHPEFIHHLLEYQGQEPRTLMSRASQMDDISGPDLRAFTQATQTAAAEFTQILSDLTQANYPRTTGLMPWSFTVPWPVEFFMFVDGLGQPTSSYYALKHTYEPTHIVLRLPELLWAKGEKVPVSASVVHALPTPRDGLTASVQILDAQFHPVWQQSQPVVLPPGPSVTDKAMGEFTILDTLEDKFFFVVAELKGADGKLVSRSVYWPRALKLMADPEFRQKYRATPQHSLVFDHGPWLHKQVEATPTSLALEVVSEINTGGNRSRVEVRVRNTGSRPAFLTDINLEGTQRAFYGTDNFFWLPAGEERRLEFEVLWRDPDTRSKAVWTVSAWNAPTQQATKAGLSAAGQER